MDILNKYIISQIKAVLKKHQLITTRAKAELIARLLAADPTGEWMPELADSSFVSEAERPQAESVKQEYRSQTETYEALKYQRHQKRHEKILPENAVYRDHIYMKNHYRYEQSKRL